MVTRPAALANGQQTKPQQARKDNRANLGPGSLAGNLTKDPELRYTPNGKPACSLRVAVAERVRDAETGKWGDGPTEYFNVDCWGQLAENVAEHLTRGARVVAEGQWQSVTWTDNDGQEQERVGLVARDLGPSMLFAGARVIRPERGKS